MELDAEKIERATLIGLSWGVTPRAYILTRAERDADANPQNRHWSQETHSHVWNRIVMEFLKE